MAPAQHGGICLDARGSFLQIQGLWLHQTSEEQSLEQSYCDVPGHTRGGEVSLPRTAAKRLCLQQGPQPRSGEGTRGALLPCVQLSLSSTYIPAYTTSVGLIRSWSEPGQINLPHEAARCRAEVTWEVCP